MFKSERLTRWYNGEAVKVRTTNRFTATCINKLARYEDSGYSPEEIMELIKDYHTMKYFAQEVCKSYEELKDIVQKCK